MAYDARKKEDEQQSEQNPYASLLEPSGGPSASFSAPPQSLGAAQKVTPGTGHMQAGGPTATGFVNFADIYNANADVAKREAEGRRQQAEGKAKAAQQGLTGAQQQFQSGLTGAAVQGPSQQDFARASGQQGFYAKPTASPIAPSGGAPPASAPPSAGPVTQTGEGLVSTETRNGPIPGGGVPVDRSTLRPGGPSIREGVNEQNTEEAWRQRMEKQARQEYKGPGSLSESELYEQLATDTAAAQDLVNNPLTGLGGMDRDLLGAAGRPGFEQLKQKYGDLTGDLDRANEASVLQAKQARGESESALAQYGALLDADDARKELAADAAPSDKWVPAETGEPPFDPETGTYPPGLDSPEKWSQLYRDWGLNVDGDTGRLDDEGKALIKALGLTQTEINVLASLTKEQRQAWLKQRKKEKGL